MAQNYMDRTTSSAVANGYGTAYSDSSTYTPLGWEAGAYIGYFGDDGFYSDKTLINFDISAIDSANVKSKKVEISLTYSVILGSPTYDAKRLTTLRYTTDSYTTVYNEIGSAANYITNKSSATFYDLGSTANTQIESWYSGGEFAIGVSEYLEDVGESGDITAYSLRYTYYYPPDEADTWQINESPYPIGKSSTLGVGTATTNGSMQVLSTASLILYGNTNLTIKTGQDIIIDKGGKITVVCKEGAKLSKTY